jgi:16S rRNA (adenine1518-N6/adenine1519-N6)-dimethyltransferase
MKFAESGSKKPGQNPGPKKYLGQHFLTAPSYAKRIAQSIPAAQDENVLEIGPGYGALSIHLIQRFARLHLVEVDPDVIGRLREKLGNHTEYTIHQCDILDFDFSLSGFPVHVAGNLPYSIGAIILKKTLLYGNNILSCTFMVQKEVAERIVSGPHTKVNGFLSIFCQFFGTPRILFNVPPGAFFPPPSVHSSVFQLVVDPDLEMRLPRIHWEDFFAFVTKGFSQRRKQLANVLGGKEQRERYAAELDTMGINPCARPEDLGVGEWLALYRSTTGR